jgi:hypothetical protein
MQIWDIRRAMQAIRQDEALAKASLSLAAFDGLQGHALYASLYEPNLKAVYVSDLALSHRSGPILLNVERYVDMPQILAMAAERTPVHVENSDEAGWEYPQAVARQLGWDPKQIQIRRKPAK